MQLCPDILKDISVKDQEGWSNMISAGHSFHTQNPTNQVCNLLLSAWFDIVLKFCRAWKYHCHALRKFSKGFDRYGCSVQTISWSRTDFLYCNGPQKRTKFCPTPCTLHYSYSNIVWKIFHQKYNTSYKYDHVAIQQDAEMPTFNFRNAEWFWDPTKMLNSSSLVSFR